MTPRKRDKKDSLLETSKIMKKVARDQRFRSGISTASRIHIPKKRKLLDRARSRDEFD